MTLGGAARQILQLPIDQVPVPLRLRIETGHSQLGHQLVDFLGPEDPPLILSHHLHYMGPQTGRCFRQPQTSVAAPIERLSQSHYKHHALRGIQSGTASRVRFIRSSVATPQSRQVHQIRRAHLPTRKPQPHPFRFLLDRLLDNDYLFHISATTVGNRCPSSPTVTH